MHSDQLKLFAFDPAEPLLAEDLRTTLQPIATGTYVRCQGSPRCECRIVGHVNEIKQAARDAFAPVSDVSVTTGLTIYIY